MLRPPIKIVGLSLELIGSDHGRGRRSADSR